MPRSARSNGMLSREWNKCQKSLQKHTFLLYRTQKTCPIVCIPAHAVIMGTHKSHAPARRRLSRSIKNGSRVHCLIASIFISKYQEWIMKNSVAIDWASHPNVSVPAYRLHGISNK